MNPRSVPIRLWQCSACGAWFSTESECDFHVTGCGTSVSWTKHSDGWRPQEVDDE